MGERETAAMGFTPEIEAYFAALDHLDAAYDLMSSVNAQVNVDIHRAREQIRRDCGFAIFRFERQKKNGRGEGA